MTELVQYDNPDAVLTEDVVEHLERQLLSARRLLQLALEQGAAIRERDVQNVVILTGLMQAELERRTLIESERSELLMRAGVRLGVDPGAVSMGLLLTVMTPDLADEANVRSAELRGLLDEVQRTHHVNRVLMNQELAFLDHLLRLAEGDRQLGYDSGGDHSRLTGRRLASRHHVLDLEV